MNATNILADVVVTLVEVVALAVLCGVLAYAVGWILRLLKHVPPFDRIHNPERWLNWVRRWLLVLFLLGMVGLIIFNTTLVLAGREVWPATLEVLNTALPPGFWVGLAIAIAEIAVLVVVTRLLLRLVQRYMPRIEERVSRITAIRTSEGRIHSFFTTLQALIRRGAWLLVLATAAVLLKLPAVVSETLYAILKIYLIVAVGRLLVSMIGTVIDTLDALSEIYIQNKALDDFYGQLRRLIPLFSRTLEYLIYVSAITLAVSQVSFTAGYAQYGTMVIELIVLFFIGRVLIEVLHLLLDRYFLVRGSLNDAQWQQRQTFAPLLKSVVQYAVFAGGILLALVVLGFDIGPILLGLGGVGLVVGLAAQPVTTDLISGVFILIENLYLVGDYIETGNASGVVESIDVRTTRIRNQDGQLHLVRNGQIGDIVNYSKGYVYAVVTVGVSYEAGLEHVFNVIRTTGKELDVRFEDVLEPTEVQGIEEFANQQMLIRTTTRVRPGRHQQMSREFRNMLHLAFEREGIAMEDALNVSLEPQVLLSAKPLEKMAGSDAS